MMKYDDRVMKYDDCVMKYDDGAIGMMIV